MKLSYRKKIQQKIQYKTKTIQIQKKRKKMMKIVTVKAQRIKMKSRIIKINIKMKKMI